MATDENTSGLTRRRLFRNAGVLGVALVGGVALDAGRSLAGLTTAAAAGSKLTLTPEQEEGPFYVALEKVRKNVTLGRPGVPLLLKINVETAKARR
jgi:hypothetical protein